MPASAHARRGGFANLPAYGRYLTNVVNNSSKNESSPDPLQRTGEGSLDLEQNVRPGPWERDFLTFAAFPLISCTSNLTFVLSHDCFVERAAGAMSMTGQLFC